MKLEPRLAKRSLRIINAVLLVVALAALAWMVSHVGVESVAAALADIGWAFAAVLAVHFCSLVAGAYSLVVAVGPPLGFAAALGIGLAGHAINEATPMAKLGELTKYGLLSERVEPARAAAGLIVWNFGLFLSGSLVIAVACIAALASFDLAPAAVAIATAAAVGFGLAFALALLLLFARIGTWPFTLLEKLGVSAERADRWRLGWQRVEAAWAEVARDRRRLFKIFAASVVIRAINIAEGAVILAVLGVEPLAISSLVGYASFQLAYWLTSWVPLQTGTAEGGAYAAFTALGLAGSMGLVLELVRKLRRLSFIAIGLVILGLGLGLGLARGPDRES